MLKKLLFLLLISSFTTLAQKKPIQIFGTVVNDGSLKIVKNVHIINLASKKGTFSNDIGLFRIPVKLGDSLKISSIQYKTSIIFIGKHTLKTRKITIQLKKNVIILDEIILKNHNLSGVITTDVKNTPIDRRVDLLKKIMTFTDAELTGPIKADKMSKNKPPIVKTIANSFEGVSARIAIADKSSERLWALRRKLAKKLAFPKKILNEFGGKFFFTELKIPKKKYNHFIEYCIPLGVEDLYEKQKILELIKILQKESIGYLKIIKKQ